MAEDTSPPLAVDRPAEHVLRIALARPERRNAIDAPMVAALNDALEEPDARVIVLTSTTPGMFCAGADLRVPDDERAKVSDGLYGLYRRMRDLPVPVVAALTGPAVGGGAQLAIASDLRVAEPGAWIKFVGPGHGLAVGAWGLPALVGRGRAFDLCVTGRAVPADEALAMGLVDRVADDAQAAALELAAHIVQLDAAAVARIKRIVERSAADSAALELEAEGNAHWRGGIPAA